MPTYLSKYVPLCIVLVCSFRAQEPMSGRQLILVCLLLSLSLAMFAVEEYIALQQRRQIYQDLEDAIEDLKDKQNTED